MESRVLHSIGDIHRADWGMLDAPSPFVSYGWLKTVEDTALDPPAFRYLAVYEGACLAGVIVVEICGHGGRKGTLDRTIFGRASNQLSTCGFSFEPAVACAAFDGYGSTLLIRKSASAVERTKIMTELLESLRRFALRERLATAVGGVMLDDTELARMLADTGFQRTLQWPVARLIPHWNSFDDYLESMRHERKSVFKDIRRDLNRLRTSGTEIAQFTPQSTDVPRLQELADANYRKYGDEVFPYGAAFFTTLTTQLQDDAVWYGAWKNDRLIAFSLMLKSSNRAWGTYFGCDYDACSDDRTYFNLVFNRPIEDAIAAGLASLYFGRGLHSLKVRRGCESVPTYLYYRARTALGRALVGPTLRLRSRYVARKGGSMSVNGKGQAQPEKR